MRQFRITALVLFSLALVACGATLPEEEASPVPEEATAVNEESPDENPEADEEADIVRYQPGPRLGALIYFNPTTEKTEIIGGYSCEMKWNFEANHFQDIWQFDNSSASWEAVDAEIPLHLSKAGYDAESGKLIILSLTPIETWAYDPVTRELENMEPDEMPPDTIISTYLVGAPMAYDSESDRLILFGGGERPDLTHEDTWAYNYNTNTWTLMEPEISPPERAFHQMVYDSESDRVILWGGFPNLENDTNIWAYDYNTDTWEEFENTNGPSTHFQRFGMIYRPVDDRMYLYSGMLEEFEHRPESFNEPATWAYDLNSNTWELIETELNPGQRMWYSMAYDPIADQIVMYGGELTAKYEVNLTNAVWLFDFESMQWSNATSEAAGCN